MNHTLFYLSVVCTLFACACQKEVCIKGIVLDSKTNKALSGVRIDMSYEFEQTGSLLSFPAAVYTTPSGEFYYSATEKNSREIGIIEIQKDGYSKAYKADYIDEDCKDVTVKLTPLDGLLNLRITNETGAHDTIYAGVFNKCEYRGIAFNSTRTFSIALPKGGTYTKTISACVGDSSAVVWKFTKYTPWAGIDSVWVATADTVFKEIDY